MTLPPETLLHGRYEVRHLLGEGGLSTVYLARDLLRSTEVALKVVPHERGQDIEALRREFATLCRLHHPRLVRVHDFGRASHDGRALAFYTADVVEGSPIDVALAGEPWAALLPPLGDGLRALEALHRAGLRHGDFKPDNLLVDDHGRGVLIDLSCSAPPPAGTVSGTRGYLAPELLDGGAGDLRADLYAVGITLEHLARGRAGVPAEVAELCETLTRAEPADRPADVAEALATLGVDEDHPVGARPLPERVVGRSRELAQAEELVGALVAGAPSDRGLYLYGPDGVGRSQLLREAKWMAQLRCRVVEAGHRRADTMTELLARATGRGDLPTGPAGALVAREVLARGPEPTLLIVDDVHGLDAGEAATLHALLRVLEPGGALAILAAGRSRLLEAHSAVSTAELRALDEGAMAEWLGGRLPSGQLGELVRVTGGLPGAVSRVMARARTGAEDLAALAAAERDGPRRARRLATLPEAERAVLGLCAASGGSIDEGRAAELEMSAEAVEHLLDGGHLLREGAELRLPDGLAGVPPVEEALPEEAARSHRRLASALADLPGAAPERIFHLARAGDLDEAEGLMVSAAAELPRAAHRFRRALEALLEAGAGAAARLLAAEAHELCGDPTRALETLAPLVEVGGEPSSRAQVELRAGSCHLKLGDAAAALPHLDRASKLAGDGEVEARAVDLACRARIQRGDYVEARDAARRALELTSDLGTRADLLEDLGVAAAYLGENEESRRHLEEAERLSSRRLEPRREVRTLSYRAILDYRAGHLDSAGERYRKALTLSEQHGLVDQAASAALNLGTIAHRRGDLGNALAAYERGLDSARAVGKVRTEVALLFDLAQLHADLGRLGRAEQLLESARDAALRGELDFFVAGCEMLSGELSLLAGQLDGARQSLDRALDMHRRSGAEREVAEVEIHRAEVELAAGDLDAARSRVGEARRAAQSAGAEDLDARVGLLEGRLLLAEQRGGEALSALEAARARAAEGGERDLLAQVESWLAVTYEAEGARHAGRKHRQAALELWDRLAATLPAPMRDPFRRHPRRAHLGPDVDQGESGSSSREQKLERLLAINARLSSSLDTKAVLDQTMDAAVELTRAERGFLILAPTPGSKGGRLRVAVARNVDRERIGRSSMKISRSIAEQVLETGEPVLTAEALSDGRFAAGRSVQAMKLQSVLSVPIRGPHGALGALYVDNRFQQGLFEQEDLEVLLALADQVGIALTNARLLEELDGRTRELEKERRRVEKLLEQRSRDVDRLEEEVRVSRHSGTRDGDGYAGIVGRSSAMQEVFETIARVADAPLTVLIHGESGTGKELVARAIHDQGRRREAPFVSINCAAVPETLLESELFGHSKGAFTGADRDRTGLFVHAGQGTLLLDEVGEMPLGMQAKLLRVLQEREVTPLGSTRPQPVIARVLGATNRRLADEVEAGRFREDLYYRLAVVEVELPPLRHRTEDIPELAAHLLSRLAKEAGRGGTHLHPTAMRELMRFDWPGNVRQLENVLSQALLFADGEVIGAADLVLPKGAPPRRRASLEAFREREAAEIAAALETTRWNVAEVSRLLGIPRTSLYRKLKEYRLQRKQP